MAVKQGRREVVRRLDEVAEQRRGASAPVVVEALLRDGAAVECRPSSCRPSRWQSSSSRRSSGRRPRKRRPKRERGRGQETDGEEAGGEQPSAEQPVVTEQPAATAPAAPSVDAASLPISDYDSLAASQVVARLEALGPDDLKAIGSYEAATRGRRTILGKVHQLQAG